MWGTRWVTGSKCSNVTGFRTCMAVRGCGKIDKMLMERVYGGRKMVHQPWKGGCWAGVHVQGLHELAWCTWCRLGGGQMQSSTWTFQCCTKHPWGPVWRCACVGGQHGGWCHGTTSPPSFPVSNSIQPHLLAL